jgi:pilus assembly protein CpaE
MRVVLAGENVGQRDQLRQSLLSLGLECTARDCVKLSDLAVRLTQQPADLVMVAVTPGEAGALAAIESARKYSAAPVLAVGPVTDQEHQNLVRDHGAREYVGLTAFREGVSAALERLRVEGAVNPRRGLLLVVTAATAGSGVTTVATGLAFALAAKHPQQVALAELGTDVPEIALHLDLEPQHSVADLLRNAARMDRSMVRQAMVAHPAGLQVLAYKPQTLAALPVEPALMRSLIVLLRTLFDCTVLDLGHAAVPGSVEAMSLADEVVVVTRMEVPSLRLTRQYLRQLVERGLSPEKLRVVVNRYGQRRQIGSARVEETLELPPAGWIPDDPATVNQALNDGKPLIQVASRASVTRRLDQLAGLLVGKRI